MVTLADRCFSDQVRGSLPVGHADDVEHPADQDLYAHLKNGDSCFVYNSLQMSTTSLWVRDMQKPQDGGVICAVIDLKFRSTTPTEEQWYAVIITRLIEDVGLAETVLLFSSWWKSLTKGARHSESEQLWIAQVHAARATQQARIATKKTQLAEPEARKAKKAPAKADETRRLADEQTRIAKQELESSEKLQSSLEIQEMQRVRGRLYERSGQWADRELGPQAQISQRRFQSDMGLIVTGKLKSITEACIKNVDDDLKTLQPGRGIKPPEAIFRRGERS
jgi:hypothetical protein